MIATDLLQVAAYIAALILLTPPLGAFMARVFAGERTLLTPMLGPIERATYRLIGVDPTREMTWLDYVKALMVFTWSPSCLATVSSSVRLENARSASFCDSS